MPSAILSARHDAGGELLLVSLDVSADVARAYTTPGQYIEVKTESGKGYFVLASEVGATPWQLLVKNAGGAADALTTLPLGSALEIERPARRGLLRAADGIPPRRRSRWSGARSASRARSSPVASAAARPRAPISSSASARRPTSPIVRRGRGVGRAGRARRALSLARRARPPSGGRAARASRRRLRPARARSGARGRGRPSRDARHRRRPRRDARRHARPRQRDEPSRRRRPRGSEHRGPDER